MIETLMIGVVSAMGIVIPLLGYLAVSRSPEPFERHRKLTKLAGSQFEFYQADKERKRAIIIHHDKHNIEVIIHE